MKVLSLIGSRAGEIVYVRDAEARLMLKDGRAAPAPEVAAVVRLIPVTGSTPKPAVAPLEPVLAPAAGAVPIDTRTLSQKLRRQK